MDTPGERFPLLVQVVLDTTDARGWPSSTGGSWLPVPAGRRATARRGTGPPRAGLAGAAGRRRRQQARLPAGEENARADLARGPATADAAPGPDGADGRGARGPARSGHGPTGPGSWRSNTDSLNDILEGVGGKVGQLHPLRLAHSASTGFSSGRRRAAAPPPARTAAGAARRASPGCGGRQPIPHQRRLLPAQRPSQLAERADQRSGVVGADLVVEGHRRAAATRAVAQPGRHRRPLPLEAVADHRRAARAAPRSAGSPATGRPLTRPRTRSPLGDAARWPGS
jgi:hypothetical protein